MPATGQCHCGAIRFEVSGEPAYHAMCHCTDCRRSSGAPAIAWALFPRDAVTIGGEPKAYASSENARRHFCAECGSGLFYTNETVFPGMIDVQTATLDDPDVFPLQIHVQVAERIGWMEHAHALPQFDRYPAGD
ncbi:GFA family protein [Novosphingobium album (ex Liu et al. 2023)]|uniref:GFA family protein n=1 Tax=Novosphingobium album (ex Liu et al. 2023) TaxID=3031130 RepID=A0ABT5WM52_9SPHN|nr:GFA family protein [Novosphingobium album (ex Liu et al. 2023)]MDE8651105.1 GFA family protein [Novosphingobium album (ex Liu et al. 2023)]